jgi:uncharacterized protein YfkK (UPF0435 family)
LCLILINPRVMSEYIRLELQTLIELLVEETSKYTKMLNESIYNDDKFSDCKERIRDIQKAIQNKKNFHIKFDGTKRKTV